MHPAPPILVDRAQDYTPKHSISARRDTLDRRAATLPGAAVRSRCEDPHQVSLPWRPTFEQVRVDGFQLPAPPKLTFSCHSRGARDSKRVRRAHHRMATRACEPLVGHVLRVLAGDGRVPVESPEGAIGRPARLPRGRVARGARDPRGAAREVLPVARAAGRGPSSPPCRARSGSTTCRRGTRRRWRGHPRWSARCRRSRRRRARRARRGAVCEWRPSGLQVRGASVGMGRGGSMQSNRHALSG